MRERVHLIGLILFAIATLLIARLAWVQLAWGPALSAQAEEQRARVYVEPARRGSIVDHQGRELAYTMQARSLTVSPNVLRKELTQQGELDLVTEGKAASMTQDQIREEATRRMDEKLKEMANEIPKMISGAVENSEKVKSSDLEKKLRADSTYEVLVRNVDPDVASEIAQRFHGVAADHQDIRQYPNGAIGENILGKVSVDGEGQFGFEASGDDFLAGQNGRSTEDVATTGQVIPGTLRDVVPAIDGADATLTIDLDLQTYVQQQIEQAKHNSGAKHAEAVVLDVQTGEVLAMANTDTINPNKNIDEQLKNGKRFENSSISFPYEPGSVAKIITAAATINEGLTTPDEVHYVPGSINMAGVTVNDAWQHSGTNFTTTGIFGKSSNVGTLMLAQRLGEEKYADYLKRFGIGQSTGVELPAESPGLLMDLQDWGGGTFANLPIGQGMSWTTLQMASVYQAIANGGERIEPRIIHQITDADGNVRDLPEPEHTQVISPEAARTVTDMFRATLQKDPAGGSQSGTAPGQSPEGYQASGKTGTAQKVDPNTGAYSMSDYWITFAGIAPADDPRFAVAIMLDDPERGVEAGGGGGQSAAPLFKDIASWLLDRDNVPTSPPPTTLVLQQ
ncbi:peptidoglycan D,D-transpeptidase FtsI family protein [Corynebacterium tapiri]|uniref:Penicillin-binding protein 2 n=1 Tax=Corynebacterium tapiri TaxID=1448266 RepID=A0A5C4U5K0_9CORY|nr:penicillin-binding protein 2 [Corynebacterium tapiri]TNL99469.1 penicillin-binding protein 2 [Corynebacterium tapiri]